MEHNLLVGVPGSAVGLGKEQLGCGSSEIVPRLANGGQRHGGSSGELDVIIADDRQLTGNRDTGLGEVLEQPEGDEIVGAERRRRTPARRPSAMLRPAVSITVSRPGSLPAVAIALRAPSNRSETQTAYITPPMKAMRRWP